MVNRWLIKPVFAENSISGLGIQPISREESVSQLEGIISSIIGFITIVAFIFFVFQVIFAGYSFISAQGDEKKLEAARSKLTNGILGLTLVVVAFGFTAFIARILGLGDVFNLQQFFSNNPN
jgi:hypothetical protein